MKKYLLVITLLLLLTGCHKKTTSNGIMTFKDTYITVIDDYIIYKEDNKLGILDLEGNIILEPKYQELISKSNNKSIIFKDNGNYIIVDKDGKEVIKTKYLIEIINDKVTKRDYYLINNSLYNDNYQLLIDNLSINNSIIMENGFIINNNQIIDIRTRRILNINYLEAYEDYTAFVIGNSYLVYDHEHETWIPYKNYKKYLMGSMFYNDNDKIYISYSKGKVDTLKEIIDPDNKLDDYSIDKDKLHVTRKKDNKLILDKPLSNYSVSNDKSIYYFESNSVDGENVNVAVFKDSIKNVGSSVIVGNYLLDKENKIIYDNDGNKMNIMCDEFYNIGENYVCNNSIVNNKLDVINEYTGLKCVGQICSINDNNKYGLYMNDKVIVKPVYVNIDIYSDYYIGVTDKEFELVYYKNIKGM